MRRPVAALHIQNRILPRPTLPRNPIMTAPAKRLVLVAAGAVLLVLAPAAFGDRFIPPLVWPEPPVITPGEGTAPPSDAIVLFDGKNFDAWNGVKKTMIDSDGGFTVKENVQTKQSFGDIQ